MQPPFRRVLISFLLLLLLVPGPFVRAVERPAAPAHPAADPGAVVINEVAWAGTGPTSLLSNDEWIELHNTAASTLTLDGWHLVDDDAMNIALSGPIAPHGYYLIERSDDEAIPDVPADWFGSFGSGGLANTGEILTLTDDLGEVVDTANLNGAGWPAGTASPDYRSMERIDPLAGDLDANWGSNTGWICNGHNGVGQPIRGTPRARNSLTWPDLVLEKGAPVCAPVAAALTYVVTVTNEGPAAAPGVRITDTLPSGFAFLTQTSPFTFSQPDAGVLSWQAGEIPPAGQSRLTITGAVLVTASGTLLNRVVATAVVTEVTGTNNLAQASTTVQPAYPDLTVSKAGPAAVQPASAITYTLLVTNIGARTAPAVRVTDSLPADVAFLLQEGPFPFTQVSPLTLVWDLGDLPAFAPAMILVHGSVVSAPGGVFSNTLWATTPCSETTRANNTAVWSTAVSAPGAGAVVINEVAWAGTAAGLTGDEWVELYNASGHAVDLAGWTLSDGGDITLTLSGVVPAGGYYLLERGDDRTVSDVPADWFGSFGGSLSNLGGTLVLRDAAGGLVDTANGDGGAWPAGTASPDYRSMERIDPYLPDADDNWVGNDMLHRCGHNADGGEINGTPRALNSAAYAPDLGVGKLGPLTTTPGLRITYTLVVSNTGIAVAPAVRLTDTLPAHVTFLCQESSFPFTFGQVFPQFLVWTAPSLPTDTVAAITVCGEVAETAAGMLVNVLEATTAAREAVTANNRAVWGTAVESTVSRIYLPLVFRDFRHMVRIGAVLCDGYQAGDMDEAVRLVNLGTGPVDLTGWELCKDAAGVLVCNALPSGAVVPSMAAIWLARDADAFAVSFGFPPDEEMARWLALSNEGDEVLLRDPLGVVVDAVVFGSGHVGIPGWSGGAVYPYRGSSGFGSEGQIIQRIADEASGWPVADTDGAADWLQYPGDPYSGRRVVYPGWDLGQFFWPLSVTEEASLTVAIAPDHAAELFLAAIDRAQDSIEAEFYKLEHYTISLALAHKASQGVSVTVLLEGEPAGGLRDQERWACQQIEEAGGQCWFIFNENDDPGEHIFDRYSNLHSKVVLVDRQWVIISSQNPTHGGMPADDKADGTWGSRGVVLVTDAPSIVARVAQILEADLDPAHHNDLARWALDSPYGYGPPAPGFAPVTTSGGVTYTVQFSLPLVVSGPIGFEVLTAPESALRSSDALLGLLARAGPGDAVDIEQMYEYRDWGQMPDGTPAPNLRLAAYLAAARRGARVRIALNAGTFGQDYADISRNAEALAYLENVAYCEGLDLQARLADPTAHGIHNKMILVRLGGQGYSHIGSINGSEASSKVNREVAVQVLSDALHAYLVHMFERDWATAGYPRVSEVLYNPDGDDRGREWVELYNPNDEPLDLSGWMLGDAAVAEEYGSGCYYFPAGTVIPARGLLTVAALARLVDFMPDLEFATDPSFDDPSVPNMVQAASWDGFGFALGNEGDEVILQDPAGKAVDVLVYGGGSFPGVHPFLGSLAAGHSLERRPPARDTGYCGADFFDSAVPTPGGWPEGYHDCE